MKYLHLIVGIILFLLSFVVYQYFLQFMVLGLFFIVLHLVNKNKQEVSDLKKLIEAHNELLKHDIEELKKK
jgi:hypothetical protein